MCTSHPAECVIDVPRDRPLVGHVDFQLLDGTLRPWWSEWERWRGCDGRSRCLAGPGRFGALTGPHAAPDPWCRCGIGARFAPQDHDSVEYEINDVAAGVVAVWGTVVVEADRVRAEHGRLLALSPAPWIPRPRAVRAWARSNGLAECGTSVAEREAWAASSGLTVAAVVGGRAAPIAVPDVAVADDLPPAVLRFAFETRGGHLRRAAYSRLPAVAGDAPVAVGDVVPVGADTAIAHFAVVSDGIRRRAEHHLRRWAQRDGWTLEIAEHARPLAGSVAESRELVCTRCRARTAISAIVLAMGWGKQDFHSTRCDCGGRTWPSDAAYLL